MAVNLSPIWGAGAQLLDNSGNVLSGGKIYTYAAGTTTPAATYTSSNGITANSNPIILNSAGRVPYEIWLTDGVSYKFVLKDSNDTLIATYDNLTGINSNFIAYTAQQEIQTATAGQTVFTLTTMQYQPGTHNLTVFVDGVNQYGPGAQYAFVETDATTVTFVSGLHVGASVKFTTATQVSSAATDAGNVSFTGVKGQSGSVADLGTMDGSDWVGFQPDGTGAVSADYSIQDKLRQTVSVKDFGAVGDGVTDDTAAIQAALAASNSVYFPEGEYAATGPIYITGRGKNVFGAGQSATKVVFDTSAAGFILGNSSTTSETNHEMYLGDMWISGGTNSVQVGTQYSPLSVLGTLNKLKITDGTTCGLYLYQALIAVNNCDINENRDGIITAQTDPVVGNANSWCQFNHCRIFQNTYSNWYCEQAWNFEFNSCDFESSGNALITFNKIDGTSLTNVTFNNCWFEYGWSDGTTGTANIVSVITGSTIPSNIIFNSCEFGGASTGNWHINGYFDNITLQSNRYLDYTGTWPVKISNVNCALLMLNDSGVDVSTINQVIKVYSGAPPVFKTNISEYADNAAAIAAGVKIGTLYRTGDVLKIVH